MDIKILICDVAPDGSAIIGKAVAVVTLKGVDPKVTKKTVTAAVRELLNGWGDVV